MPTSIDMLGKVQFPDRKVCEFKPPVSVAADTVPLDIGEIDATRVKVFPVLPSVS